jgi:hypothetical protein
MKKTILFSAILATAIIACKKPETNTTPTPTYTKADTLQNGKWKLTSATAAGGVFDLTTSMQECQKDNLYTFNADKTITVDEGATKCAPSDVSPRNDGNWSLITNNTQLNISGSSITTQLGIPGLTGDLVKLDATTLQIKKDTTILSLPTTVVITFTNTK